MDPHVDTIRGVSNSFWGVIKVGPALFLLSDSQNWFLAFLIPG